MRIAMGVACGLLAAHTAAAQFWPAEPPPINAETQAAVRAADAYRTIQYASVCVRDMPVEDRRRLVTLRREVENDFLAEATTEQQMAYVVLTRQADLDFLDARRWDGTGQAPPPARGAQAFLCQRISASLAALLLDRRAR